MPKNNSRITYYPEGFPGRDGVGAQATSTADREWCALVAAYACWAREGRQAPTSKACGIWGPSIRLLEDDGRTADRAGVMDLFQELTEEQGLDWHRFGVWVDGILNPQRGTYHPFVATDDGETLGLDTYQIATCRRTPLAGGVLDLDTGLGKTATTVCLAIDTAQNLPACRERCWILCPLNATGAWVRFRGALESWFKDVRIVSMDSAHKLLGDPTQGGVLICDEAHELGEPTARRTKAALELRKSFHTGFCLTGSLLHGGVTKTLAIHDLAVPGCGMFANKWKCGERFRCIIEDKFGKKLGKPGRERHGELYEYLSRHVVSLDKKDEDIRAQIGLGDIDQELVTVEIGQPWQPINDLVADTALEIWDEVQNVEFPAFVAEVEQKRAELDAAALEESERLFAEQEQQALESKVAAGPEFPHAARVAHRIARLGVQEKLEWLAENLDEDDLPVVIGANYTDTVQVVCEALDDAGYSYVRVDGTVTGAERVEIEKQFQRGEAQFFVGQLVAASVAMNLFRSCVSVTFDLCWRAAAYYQFLGRTYRRGQARDCVHIDLVSNQLQQQIVNRLRESMDFDASCSEWQKVKGTIKEVKDFTA